MDEYIFNDHLQLNICLCISLSLSIFLAVSLRVYVWALCIPMAYAFFYAYNVLYANKVNEKNFIIFFSDSFKRSFVSLFNLIPLLFRFRFFFFIIIITVIHAVHIFINLICIISTKRYIDESKRINEK